MKSVVRYCCIFALFASLCLTNDRVYSDELGSDEDYSMLTKGSEEDRSVLKKLNELLEKANKSRDVVKSWLGEYSKQERKTYARVVDLFSKFEKAEQKQLVQDLKKGELSEPFRDRLDAQNLLICFQRLEVERNYLEKIKFLHDRLSAKILEAESTREIVAQRIVADVQPDKFREKEEVVDELSKFLDETQQKLDVWKENDRKQKESLLDSIVKDSKNKLTLQDAPVVPSDDAEQTVDDSVQDVDQEIVEEPSKEQEIEQEENVEAPFEDQEADQEEIVKEIPEEQEVKEEQQEVEALSEERDIDEKTELKERRREKTNRKKDGWKKVKQASDVEEADLPKPMFYVTATDLQQASNEVEIQTNAAASNQRQIISVGKVEIAFRLCSGIDRENGEDFWIQETETTQEQWFAVVPKTTRPCGFNGAKLPVENVDWNACVNFVKRLNELNVAPEGWAFTIPTEAQWEYAWKLGDKKDNLASLVEYAWFGENSDKKTHEVATKKPDALGLYDMSGNVWEWTRSTDASGKALIVRGASWNNLPQNGTLTDSFKCAAQTCGNNLGLRLALVRKPLVAAPNTKKILR